MLCNLKLYLVLTHGLANLLDCRVLRMIFCVCNSWLHVYLNIWKEDTYCSVIYETILKIEEHIQMVYSLELFDYSLSNLLSS